MGVPPLPATAVLSRCVGAEKDRAPLAFFVAGTLLAGGGVGVSGTVSSTAGAGGVSGSFRAAGAEGLVAWGVRDADESGRLIVVSAPASTTATASGSGVMEERSRATIRVAEPLNDELFDNRN